MMMMMFSMKSTVSGLLGMGECVTWRKLKVIGYVKPRCCRLSLRTLSVRSEGEEVKILP